MARLTLVLVLLAAVTSAAALANVAKQREQFAQWKAQHGRKYASSQEEARRFECFLRSLEMIEANAALNPKAKFGLNRFADQCHEEFAKTHLATAAPDGGMLARLATREARTPDRQTAEQIIKKAGPNFDWREKGAVTEVKDQANCGSCWAFSAIGNMEGQWFLETGKLISMSEQQLVSCDKNNSACNGGWTSVAISFSIHNGVAAEEDYPYVSGAEGLVPECDAAKASDVVAKFAEWQYFPRMDEVALQASLVTTGPLALAVYADPTWQFYGGGIITDYSTKYLENVVNHGVLLVGYGEEDGVPYWTVKNSWGDFWGESGYIRWQRGGNFYLMTDAIVTALTASRAGGVCNEECGDGECCFGQCCEHSADSKCCAGGRYSALDTCCNSSSVCCPGHEGGQGGGCCPSQEQCCGETGCCATGQCHNGECCPEDKVCGDSCCERINCCGYGTEHATCMGSPYVSICCPNTNICPGGTTCCGENNCCKTGFLCGEDGECSCPQERSCGDDCCPENTPCCTSEDGKKSTCMTYEDDICCPSGVVCGGVLVCCGDNCCFPDGTKAY